MNLPAAEQYLWQLLEKGLPAQLTYHSVAHTRDVVNSALRIADTEGVTGEERQLLHVAALYHDAGFVNTYAQHEEESCRIASEVLPGFGFSEKQLVVIQGMIRATRLPQEPHNLLEQIICDADLDYLGREDCPEIADRLFREFLAYGVVADEVAWNRLQVKFFETHHYFTATANRWRNAGKAARLVELRQIVSGYAPAIG